MVAENEQVARRYLPRALTGGWIRRLALVEIRLDQGHAVDPDLAVVDRNGIAGHADHPPDERRRTPSLVAGRGREDDHVTALVVIEPGRELVHEHVVTGLERVLHRWLLNLVGL